MCLDKIKQGGAKHNGGSAGGLDGAKMSTFFGREVIPLADVVHCEQWCKPAVQQVGGGRFGIVFVWFGKKNGPSIFLENHCHLENLDFRYLQ